MRIFSIFLMIFIVSSTAQADIFLKRDGASESGQKSRPIFVNPFKKGAETKKAPQYPILNKKNSRDTAINPAISGGEAAKKLQSRKLREARAKQYKRNRQKGININTIAEDMAATRGNVKLSDLVDSSAYDAALKASSNDKTQFAREVQAQNKAQREKHLQNIEKLGKQAKAQANQLGREQNQNGRVRTPRNRSDSRVLTP